MTRVTLALATGMLLTSAAEAQERRAQYRLLELSDKRQITAEILATEATGLRLRTPQGEMLLSFDLLKDMKPADTDAFNLQEAWFIYVAAPPTHQERLLEAFRWVPTTRVARTGESLPGLDVEIQAAAGDCKLDFPCLLEKTQSADWMYVVSVSVGEDGSVTANAGLNSGPTRTRVTKPDASSESLYQLAHEALFLDVPDGPAPESAFALVPLEDGQDNAKLGPISGQPNKLLASTFVPLPGLTAARQKNGGGVGAALAITTAGTAAWVGAVGHTAQTPAEFAGLGAVGFYACTVLANQITLKR